MSNDRSWMWNRMDADGYVRDEWLEGVDKFLDFAFSHSQFVSNQKIKCPCTKCINMQFLTRDDVILHLMRNGFARGYTLWSSHGETTSRRYCPGQSSRSTRLEQSSHANVEESSYVSMVLDAAGPDFDRNFEGFEQSPNPSAQKFYELLKAADEPLWKGCKKHTTLSAMAQLLNIKSEFNLSEACFNRYMSVIKNMLPQGDNLPNNFYDSKKQLAKLGLGYVKIDACVNNCMLYYKENENKIECLVCQHDRYKPSNSRSNKKVPYKVLRYLPLTPRLQRLFMTDIIAKEMTWHFHSRREDGNMGHPSHAEAWKSFDRIHPTFAAEPRNVRLGLCTDGFSPFGKFGNQYSCWPVIIAVYNLPPELCMSEPYMFLNMVIPGPKSPGKNIDVFLRPLIDELKDLWTVGVLTYDAYRKENFQLKASLLWTISDFPANAVLSGWSTHGRLACPYCMEFTKSFTLSKGGKQSWFDCHRQFLPCNHPYRRQRDKFRAGRVEQDEPPPRLSGLEMKLRVDCLPDITFGALCKRQEIPGFGVTHNWVKKSIFWELPYWHTNLIRHNLDVMHIEKNIFDNILNTIMDVKGKTKDNGNARMDLELFCKRPELHLFYDENGKLCKPKASYTLGKDQIRELCAWAKQLKFPDGYASNIARCVNDKEYKFQGLKSHDCHVFMQKLMPVAFHDLLPKPIWETLSELSMFFRDICATVLQVNHLDQMEKNIIETLCKLEKIFPPSFFDSMEHLPIHLSYEAKVGGPVQYRWMYPFERFLHGLKKKVKNQARVEGSIVEAYIVEEVSTFCSMYFEADVQTKLNRVPRNDDGEDIVNMGQLSIFSHPGRPLGQQTQGRWLHENEWTSMHRYVLMNCEEMFPLIEEFDMSMTRMHPSKTAEELAKMRDIDFQKWLTERVKDPERVVDDRIKAIAYGPNRWVKSYNGYFVNGYKFHTADYGQHKTTMNSGVCVLGSTWNEDEVDYYGMLTEIIELEYFGKGNKVVLFKCDWYDQSRNRIKVHPRFGTVEINHTKKLHTDDLFVLAKQAQQVYYTRFPSMKRERRDWWAVCKVKPRNRISIPLIQSENEDTQTRNIDAFQEEGTTFPQPIPISVDLDHNCFVDDGVGPSQMGSDGFHDDTDSLMFDASENDNGGFEELFDEEEHVEEDDEISSNDDIY